MAFDLTCKKCVPHPCNIPGMISLDVSARASTTYLTVDCSSPNGDEESSNTVIKGPTVGTINFSAYAFSQSDPDCWLGTRCYGQVQASQSIVQKYDGTTDKYYLIPSKDNTASIAGDITENTATMDEDCIESVNYRSQIMGNATVTTAYRVKLGRSLNYKRGPISFSMPLLKRKFTFPGVIYNEDTMIECFLTSFTLNIDFPSPATAEYSFQFINRKC